MSREIEPDYETQYLFPRSLEEWVGPEHPARFIREFVDALDADALGISEEQQAKAADPNGRPHYGVKLLLKVWLYGYMYRVRSSRALERGCRDTLPLMWLAGTHDPDHNTLWRFWARYHDTIRAVFRQTVQVAMRENLVGLVLQAVDGTKVRSAASKRTAWHEADLKKLEHELDKSIDRLERQIAASEEEGQDPDDTLPKELQKKDELRKRIKAALEELNKARRKDLHGHDPDARMMVSGGRTEFAYNGQAVVDEKQGIIVAAEVTTDANDEKQLAPMLEQTRQNIGRFAETTVADSGYNTAESLGAAAEMKADVLVALKQKKHEVGPFHTMNFTYEPTTDSVRCPEGQILPRLGKRRHKDKPYAMQTYQCRNASSCPVAAQCTKDRVGRVIEISPHHEAIVRNRDHPNARDLLKRRQSVVERAFAEIKAVLGVRRWSFRGIEKVKAEWQMTCAAMNLRRMIAYEID